MDFIYRRDQAKANNQLEEVLRLDREIAKIHREMDIKQVCIILYNLLKYLL